MVTDLVAAIDALGLSQAWVVGHSMGAATSLLATLDRPKAFEKAWVYEPIIFQREVERPVGSFDFIEAAKRRRSVFPSRNEVIARYGSRLPLNELHPSCLEAYVQHGFEQQPNAEVKLICDPILEARAFEQFLQDGWEKLPLITVPTRVAFGTDSDQQPLQSACEAIALRLPRGETNPFEGSRHFGCFGSLEKSAQSIKDWFLSD
jgi:pimeloyl-ACP methyl ester carboxylesterase